MAEKVIQTGIIGFGLAGRVFHAPFLQTNPGFRIRSIVERHRNESAENYFYARIDRDYQIMLQDEEIDLAVICVPNFLHYQVARDCLLAGKHVVIDKPFTPSSEEADDLIELAESENLKIFVYQNRRWDGDFLSVQRILSQKMIGDIVEYEAHFDRYRPVIEKVTWRDENMPGGGILYDLGSHLIDQAMQLFGKPEGIFADIRKQRPGSQVDDYFDVHLYYPGFKAILKAGMMVIKNGPHFNVTGKQGSFVKYGMDPQEMALKAGHFPDEMSWGEDDPKNHGTLTINENGHHRQMFFQTFPGRYQSFYNNVYDVLVNKHQQAVKPQDARNVIRIIERAFRSNELKKVIFCE
jgi:predicted dehydrogenase